MILWYLVFIQYVALSEALTTQTPNLWPGFDPIFGSWFDTTFGGAQAPNSNAVSVQGPGVGSVFTQENVPAERPIEPLTTPPTTPPTYETAPPTRPFLPTGPTERSISLRELIRLAIGQNTGELNQGIVSNIFGGVSKDTVAGPLDLKLTSKSPETTTLSNPKQPTRVQELAIFPSTTKPTKASTPKVKVTTTPATTTTTTTRTTRATTTTTKPTTTTTTTTKRPTTTTTTTTPSIMLTTNKPIVKMTLGEILMLRSKQNAEANQVTVKTTTRRRGCFYRGSFYEPLKEIEKGQTGNWCYGTYCNHAGTVVHWDDHNCGTTATTPPVTEATKPAQPVTAQSGIPDILNSARAAGMSMVELSRFAELMGMSNNAGTSGIGTSGIGTGGMGASGMGVIAGANNIGNTNSGIGCFHNGQLYAPGTDIENHRDYGRCYGSYCDYNSNIVQWNDRCTATVPPPPTTMGGMGQMGMGMGGQMDLMNQMSMGGQTGTGMTMEQMALASHLGIEGLGSGGTGGMGMEGAGAGGMGMGGAGGMGGMGMGGAGGMAGMGMGGIGMGGQGGMGAQSQGGLSMRQLQQLDLI